MKSFPFNTVLAWYKENGRHDLPWRDYGHEQQHLLYRVWIAEIMLQQTQVSRVIDYFERFLERFPTIESLRGVSWEQFFPYYEGLGYYRRGRNMLLLSQKVLHEHDGLFPKSIESWESLPGIGPYTARSVCAFALDQPVLSFDTNLLKVFSRYYFGDKGQKLPKEELISIQKDFEKTKISGRDINNALMDFGALVSIRNPDKIDWNSYPLEGCKFAQSKGKQEEKILNSEFGILNSKKKSGLDIVVHLHEDHKVYFSADPDSYSPFILGKAAGDHRTYIKDWFKKRHNLTLSVRPPYDRDQENIYYHAQIQQGDPGAFGEFCSKNNK